MRNYLKRITQPLILPSNDKIHADVLSIQEHPIAVFPTKISGLTLVSAPVDFVCNSFH